MLCSYLALRRRPPRLAAVAPGRGGLDWEAIIRAVNEIGYDGALTVEFQDAGMNREYGAEEAYQFVKRLDFDPPPRPQAPMFR